MKWLLAGLAAVLVAAVVGSGPAAAQAWRPRRHRCPEAVASKEENKAPSRSTMVLTWLIAAGTGVAVLAGVARAGILMMHFKVERDRPKAPWEKEPPNV